MTKVETAVEHAIVTFFEAALAYIIVIPTVNWSKTVIAGAIGAGLSAVYNTVRLSTSPTEITLGTPVVSPADPPASTETTPSDSTPSVGP